MSIQQQIAASNQLPQASGAPETRAEKRARKKWKSFIAHLTVIQIKLAEKSLRDLLGVERLDGKSFLDVGMGSGLFSLAARRLGASVYSFDIEPHAVSCANELRRRYFKDDRKWTIKSGSVLDRDFLRALGEFDVVFCWGVLHQTGAMFEAFGNVKSLVAMNGQLVLAIYNDQGSESERWLRIKKRYNSLPQPLAALFAFSAIAAREMPEFLFNYRNGSLKRWLKSWREFEEISLRGRGRWPDWIDWLQDYPCERASIEQILDLHAKDGFELTKLVDSGEGVGCNEFAFRRVAGPGCFVESRVPGIRSLSRGFGRRVVGPFTFLEGQWIGRLNEEPYIGAGAKLFLLRENEIVGPAERIPDGGVIVGYENHKQDELDSSVFYVVAAMEHELLPPFGNAGGRMWEKPVPEYVSFSDRGGEGNQSCAFVFEDGIQLPFPHSPHVDIQRIGKGRFSHWGPSVFFSTSDGREPNRSPRIYRILIPSQPVPPDRSVATIFGVPLQITGKTSAGWVAAIAIEKLPILSPETEYFLIRRDTLVGPVAPNEVGDVIVADPREAEALVRRSDYRLLVGKCLRLERPFRHEGGFMWSKRIPELADIADRPDGPFVSPVFVFQDGHQLAPPHCSQEDISGLGAGRFSHWDHSIFFSSQDSSDPNRNGSAFTIFVPSVPRAREVERNSEMTLNSNSSDERRVQARNERGEAQDEP